MEETRKSAQPENSNGSTQLGENSSDTNGMETNSFLDTGWRNLYGTLRIIPSTYTCRYTTAAIHRDTYPDWFTRPNKDGARGEVQCVAKLGDTGGSREEDNQWDTFDTQHHKTKRLADESLLTRLSRQARSFSGASRKLKISRLVLGRC